MDTPQTSFDWIAWIATIPGIPADWGISSSPPAPIALARTQPAPQSQASHADLPRAA